MSEVALKLIEINNLCVGQVTFGTTALLYACDYNMEKVALKLIETGNSNPEHDDIRENIALIRYYLKYKSRPEKFRKDYKFPEVIKDGNPCNSKSIASVKCRHALRSAITLSFDD